MLAIYNTTLPPPKQLNFCRNGS